MSAQDDPFLWRAAITIKILCALGVIALIFMADMGLLLVMTAIKRLAA